MDIPQLSFPHGFDEKIASEAEQKGYWAKSPSGCHLEGSIRSVSTIR